MVSSLEVPVRAESANLSLPATGGGKLVQVAFPLSYSGSTPSKVLSFAAASAGEVELGFDGHPSPWKAVCRLTGARLKLPNGEDEKPRVLLALVLAREDVREARELLQFLLDAADAQALELDLRAKVVQPPLPFAGEEDLEVPSAPAPRRRRPGPGPAPA